MSQQDASDLESFFEFSPDLLAIANFSGYFIDVNPSWSRVLGWSGEEIRSSPFIDFVHPDDRAATQAEAAKLAEGQRTLHFENRYRAKDGSYRWLTWTAHADVDRELIHCAARDVTTLKIAEAAQRELAAIVTSSEYAIIGKALDETITSWNRSAERLYGYAPAEVIGRSISMLVPEGRADDLDTIMGHIRSGEGIEHFETQRLRKDGSLCDVSLSVSPVRDSLGFVSGAAVIARDIGEEVRQRRALTESNNELQQFAFIASHDLQEPLRMVASYLQLLERKYADILDADGREFIGYAVDGARRMQALIDDLLTLSRVSTKGKELQEVDAENALEETLSNLQVGIEESGAEVTHEHLPVLWVDRGQLVQLFQNLLANSIKYRGDDPPRIHISVAAGQGVWQFSVSDNGIGIEPRFGERIFEIFQRLHTQAEYPGTGIGLALCKKIVERHEGQIWLEAPAKEGTTVVFTFPRIARSEVE